MLSRRLLLISLIILCLHAIAASQARRQAVWFEGARLIIGDKSPVIENSAFLVEGDSFSWVGKKGDRQPPSNATRMDLTGKTVMPAMIDGHNHIGLVNEKDGSNTKANYTRDNLIDQLQRYVYYGTAAAMSMGLEADQELAYKLRDELIPNAAKFLTVGKGIGGGVAVAAVMGRAEVMIWPPDSYTSTFLTNNLNLAAAVAAIAVLRDERLAERAARLGPAAMQRLRGALAGAPGIAEVRGCGLWFAIELAGPDGRPASARAAAVMRRLREDGVIVGRSGYDDNVIKLSPPLVIGEAELDRGLDWVAAAIAEEMGKDP